MAMDTGRFKYMVFFLWKLCRGICDDCIGVYYVEAYNEAGYA